MKTALSLALCLVLSFSLYTIGSAAKRPRNAPMLNDSVYQTAAAGTTVLGWWQFDTGTGQPTPQGWTAVDMTAQINTFFHVDGPACNGVTAVNGAKSMWCGQWATSAVPYCGWAALPGYGNNWDQSLATSGANTSSITYTCTWDSEPGYDFTYVQYYDNGAMVWVDLPVNGGTGYYDGSGGPATETHAFTGPTDVRFHFVSDLARSDEDGLWTTSEGSFKVDDITTAAGFEDWEVEFCNQTGSTDAVWAAQTAAPYGQYAALHSAAIIVQEDACLRPLSNLWGFFDNAMNTNYACGGWPLQGAVPYGPDADGLYIHNEVWSPFVPLIGSGNQYRLQFVVYKDLPLDNLQFFTWAVRTQDAAGCPTVWQDEGYVYYGGHKFWLREWYEVGSFVPGTATDVQVSIGVIDMCRFWCGVSGTGSCHSHAPLFDQVRLVRVDVAGPQWNVRHIDLFQDNFPEDGSVTGYARADMGQDMLPAASPLIVAGDSIAFEVSDPGGLATEPQYGGPAVYLFAKVVDRFGSAQGVGGLAMGSPDKTRYIGDGNALLRYPYCGSAGNPSAPAGLPAGWHQFRCDRAYTPSGGVVPHRFAADLRDIAPLHTLEDAGNTGAFVPGHVVRYFLGAKNSSGIWSYWHRTFDAGHSLYTMEGQGDSQATGTLATAVNAACEFSILPDAGLLPGDQGDILFVDDADDRGGPAQLYLDWCFDSMGILDRVDRFDILDSSTFAGNSLASRVKSVANQIIGTAPGIYQKIIWNSGNRGSGLIGDGGPLNGGSGPKKSDDFGILKFFLDNHPNNPGVYAAGDNIAEEWNTLAGPNAVAVRGMYMPYILTSGNHAAPPTSLPVSPLVYQNTGRPIGPAIMTAFGGCPIINAFDVMAPGGPSCIINSSYVAKDGPFGAVMIQATPNAQATTARFVLSGFAFNYIRDDVPAVPQDRCVFLHDIITWFENIVDDPIGIDPVAYANRLDHAYPNPFNPSTTIRYSIKDHGHVSLTVYNAAGQLVRTLVNDVQTPRTDGFSVEWDGTNNAGQAVSSGVYFYKLTAAGFVKTKKMVLLK
jgi:hypothetical protein